MSIYDSKTLVADIAKFLQSGTKVMKQSRACCSKPHQKRARIRNGVLFWFDPTTPESQQIKTCIPQQIKTWTSVMGVDSF